jgi:hypothetical protein
MSLNQNLKRTTSFPPLSANLIPSRSRSLPPPIDHASPSGDFTTSRENTVTTDENPQSLDHSCSLPTSDGQEVSDSLQGPELCQQVPFMPEDLRTLISVIKELNPFRSGVMPKDDSEEWTAVAKLTKEKGKCLEQSDDAIKQKIFEMLAITKVCMTCLDLMSRPQCTKPTVSCLRWAAASSLYRHWMTNTHRKNTARWVLHPQCCAYILTPILLESRSRSSGWRIYRIYTCTRTLPPPPPLRLHGC